MSLGSQNEARHSSQFFNCQKKVESVARVIGYLDIDSFECQVWQRESLQTRGLPCVVVTASGRVLAATNEAKCLGISRDSTPTLKQAQKKYKNLVVFRKGQRWGKQDNRNCRLATWEIVQAINEFLASNNCKNVVVELASSDEIYLELSSEVTKAVEKFRQKFTGKLYRKMESDIVWEKKRERKSGPFKYFLPNNYIKPGENPKVYANINEERWMFGGGFMSTLCDYVYKKTGLSASAGVGRNKLLAKLGCGLNKPKKVTVLSDLAFPRFARNLPISSIPGLGGDLGMELKERLGLDFAYNVWQFGYDNLEKEFGADKAQSIWSKCSGFCDDPVMHRPFKEFMRINKPAPDIVSKRALDLALGNLTGEITEILQEELSRNLRKVDKLRLVCQFDGQQQGILNDEFDVSTKEKLCELQETISHHILRHPGFKEDKLRITVLGVTLSNFSYLESGPTPFEVKKSNANSLRIFSKATQNSTLPTPLTFRHQNVHAFTISKDLDCKQVQIGDIPELLPSGKLDSLVGVNLLENFNEELSCSNLQQDYISYDEEKIMQLCKWFLQTGRYMESLRDVKIVSTLGRIIRALKTPLNKTFGEWDTYAMRKNGVIYLWDEKTSRSAPTYIPKGNYVGTLLENLVTGKVGKEDVGLPVNAYEKVQSIQKVSFGGIDLLLLSNIDCKDSSGNWVQVQLSRGRAPGKRFSEAFASERKLKLWAQGIVSGSDTSVIGRTDYDNKLVGIDIIKVLVMDENKYGDECFEFLHRFLIWIQEQLPEDPEDETVKRFSWVPSKKVVEASTIPTDLAKKLLLKRIFAKLESP